MYINIYIYICEGPCDVTGIHRASPAKVVCSRELGKKHAHLFGRLGLLCWDLGVSKNRGTPKWMVYNGNPY